MIPIKLSVESKTSSAPIISRVLKTNLSSFGIPEPRGCWSWWGRADSAAIGLLGGVRAEAFRRLSLINRFHRFSRIRLVVRWWCLAVRGRGGTILRICCGCFVVVGCCGCVSLRWGSRVVLVGFVGVVVGVGVVLGLPTVHGWCCSCCYWFLVP